ncbi:uncharacterized protein LOC107431637 isoform X1 [Ziziphus jujuba]|uniref:Uncharacterized protein LOC107431637 isoform X1 n=1 Tax=Ziziphus jujuba TaxID=326968 RepID=A0A6P6FJP5_ZIZJJ|nr:uncharacterized protein LOC107431637 isoform X1 [Ziziphus jujuba]
MSPATVDIRSPINPSHSKASSLQNPNSIYHTHASSPFNFASLSPGFAVAGQCGTDPSSSFPRSGAVASGRSRPRLTKVRKQLGGRSRTTSSELGSGFNPFCSVNDGNSASSGGNGNVGFVFGANQSGSHEKIWVNGETQSSVNVGKLSSDESRKCNIGNGTESAKIGNVGFVFGARENAPELNMCWENRRSAGKAKKMVHDDDNDDTLNKETESGSKCESFSDMGLVFGCNGNGLASNSNADKRECSNFAKKAGCDDSGQIKFGECGRTFIFRTYHEVEVDLDSANLNSEKGDSTKSVKKSEFSKTGETETSLLFGSQSSDSKSTKNLHNGKFAENFGQSACYGSAKTEIGKEAELKKNDESVFVFGASWSNSEANSCEEKSQSSENLGKPACNVRRKMKVGRERRFPKMKGKANVNYSLGKDNDIRSFFYGSSTKTASTSSGCTAAAKCEDGMKASSEILRNCSGNANNQIDNICSCIFDSSDEMVSVSSAASVHNLPDEMKKLNINNSVNVEGADEIKESLNNANGCSETSGGNSKGGSVHVEMTSGGNSETIGQYHFIFRNDGNAADASGIPISEPFRTGLGENVDVGQCRQFQAASAPSSFSSAGLEFQPSASNADFVGGVKDKDKKFTWSTDGLRIPYVDFMASLCDPSRLKDNLFPDLNKKSECGVKNSTIKGKRLRKTKGKLKKSLGKQWPVSDQVPKESSSQENQDSPGCYSPMDLSPYQETNVSDQDSRKASTHQDRTCPPCASGATVPADLKGDDLAKPGEGLDSNGGGHTFKELKEEKLGCHEEIFFNHNCSSISGAEFTYSNSKMEQVCGSNGAGVASAGARVDFNSETEKQEKNSRMQFQFSSGLEDVKGSDFTFSAKSAVQGGLSAAERRHKRKNRNKVGHESFVINPSPNIKFESSSAQSSPLSTPSLSEAANKSEAGEQFKQGYNFSPSGTHETCEKWRFRGNKAYEDKNLSKAEEFYTQGIISVPSNERSGRCLQPLVLCYSNRAVTRMCLGKMKEAIGDCMMAVALDPSFLKAQLRAAKCHLALGEVEDAIKYFNKCLESGADVCLDRRIIIDAADGLQKAQKVAEWTEISAELLEQKNPDAALSALESISEALSISLYSESLLEMKAEALHMLRRHEEAIQLCEQSLCFAEKNFISGNGVTDIDGSRSDSCSPVRLWRWCLTSKSYFHLGRLEAALALLDKLILIKDKFQSKNLESSILLAVTIREILHHKNAGNEAFKSGRYAEAVEHYTAALSNNVESRPFVAICFCNRAAAHQALGQIADAIADCSLAIALDGNYAKAISRRATLHEMIRDYAQAATDLQRLISILKNRCDDKTKESCTPGRSTASVKELKKAQLQLSVMEEEAKKGICLDFYLILGCKLSDTPSDIKKAYRKAALKHHPDKAGQFLARSDSGDEGRLWKEISLEVKKDADRLFKMIGEAYTVLSDPTKRSEYDLEEDMRKAMKRSNGSSTHSRAADFHRRSDTPRYHQYERNAYRRNGRENWKTYGNSSSRW